MIRRLHLACFIVLLSVGCVSAQGAVAVSVSGTVRDSAGVPQIGAVVQLLRPDMSVIASVYTNDRGRFSIASVAPGRYAVKALGTAFLPSLRENIRVHASTVVNLTLNTLYEVMQWLPVEPRSNNAQKDDWAWTLRSAANRPLLRWLEDGPLVVVSDGAGATPKLKARLMATGQDGTFGESGERFSAMVEETPSNSRELLARVDFAPETDAGMESMLGFRQDLGYAGSVQSVAAVAIHPEIGASGTEEAASGLEEAALRSSERMILGDELEAEAGSEEVLVRLSDHTSGTVTEALPFVSVSRRDGNATIRYSMSTSLPGTQDAEDADSHEEMPAVSMHNGDLAIEHGVHQQIGWERHTDASGITVQLYSDHIDNPVVEASDHSAKGDEDAAALLDSTTGLLHSAGPDFSTTGMLASVEHRLPGNTWIRFSYADGDALVMPTALAGRSIPAPVFGSLAQALGTVHPRRIQMYSLSLSGTIEGTATRWHASYRWQPEESVTRVASFADDAAAPWLNLHLRQPFLLRRTGASHVELLLDVRNLLAEGYQPVLLSDGSYFIFAQDQRSVRGGLAFTF